MRLSLSSAICQAALLLWAQPTASGPVQERDLDGLDGLDLPDVGTLIDTGITVLETLIQTLETGQTVQNGLAGVLGSNTTSLFANGTDTLAPAAASANTTCPDMAVLFARGTDEPGNVGFLTGPPFFTALQNYINGTAQLAIQGIDYPATVSGFLAGGSPVGAAAMARLANDTLSACPGSALVLAGYSQGAQVVHNAAASLPAATAARLSSVVLFGDPRNGSAVAGVDAARTLVVCHAGDDVCAGGDLVLPPHLNYSGDAPAAAMFVMQRSGKGLASKDAMMQGMGNVPTMENPAPGSSLGS